MLASRCSSNIVLQICRENIWKRKKNTEFFCVCIQPYPISILESNFKKNRMNPFIQTFTYKIHYKSMSSTSSHTKWTKIFRQNVRLSGKCATTVSTVLCCAWRCKKHRTIQFSDGCSRPTEWSTTKTHTCTNANMYRSVARRYWILHLIDVLFFRYITFQQRNMK